MEVPLKVGTPLFLCQNASFPETVGNSAVLVDIVDGQLKLLLQSGQDCFVSLCVDDLRGSYFPVQVAFAATTHALQGGNVNCVPVGVARC